MHTLCQKKKLKYFIAALIKTAWYFLCFLGIYCLVEYLVSFALII